ncbi:MAG TPA: site-specific integrase [Sphingobium sp.]
MLDTTVIDRWAAERKVTPKGKDTHRAVARWFYDRIGDISVAEITRAHVIAFKDKLLEEGQSLANVKMKLSRLRTLLQWAADNDLAPSNVGHGVRIKGAAAGGSKRLPFALADLQAIFAGPVYTGGPRSKQGAGEAAYWLPLLALFTGARMEELGQLRPSDILRQNYPDADGVGQSAWFIRITTLAEDGDEANRLKNEASERLVPIHSEIEGLGFIHYVNAMRKAGHPRIFPLLTPGAYNRLTGKWGQWFSRYMRDVCKVTDRRKVFHSFRHTFKHFAGHVGMIEGVQRGIMGHSPGDVADDYRGGYTPHQLVEGMKVFKVAGLVLPRPTIAAPVHTDTP